MTELKKNNRGATMVLVLVTVAFLAILGTTVLFGSYTGFVMRMVGRKGSQTFYEAETIMNEVRAGFQQVASDSIIDAYTTVLTDYNTAVNTEDAFHDCFETALFNWTDEHGEPLFIRYADDTAIYYPDVVERFVQHPDGVTISGEGKVTLSDRSVTIRGLSISYVKDGYESNVSTDVVISYPDFTYTISELILTAVPDFTVISRNELLQQSGGSIVVDGNAYAGSIRVAGSGNTMNVGTADNFICRGSLTAENGGRFTTKAFSSLWAGRILLTGGGGSVLDLAGDTYVADDMELAGLNSRSNLSGRYFGFGNSLDNPHMSSSIIVSGRDTELNMSGLRNLMLAGNSFITPGMDNYIMMGESISVKSDQLAYLIPAKCIGTVSTNPALFDTATVPGDAVLKGYVNRGYTLWSGRTLGSYIDDVQLFYYPVPGAGKTLVYFYMKFNDRAGANEYFEDYFSRNKAEIERYTDVYSDLITIAPMAPRATAGGVITYSDTSAGLGLASPVMSESTPTRLTTMFNNLCATLSTNVSGPEDNTTVYDYIVDEEAIASAGNLNFTDTSGNIVARMIVGNARIDNSMPESVKIIVATGDVVVDRHFYGLVISGDNIRLQKSVNADHNGVADALLATATYDGREVTLLDFLEITSGPAQTVTGISAINWDLERLVTYDNWERN